MRHAPVRFAFIAVLTASALAAIPARAQTPAVGVTGAVNTEATSTPPAAPTRTLFIGASLVMQERVRTGADGTVQIAFIDRSTLAVGRNSDIVIDQYVYNPATNAGTMTATMTRGVLRFVGGRISHQEGVTINTPSATIGIRGGTAIISVVDGVTQALNLFGNMQVSTNAGSTNIIRPGFLAAANGRSLPPGEPRLATAQEIAGFTNILNSTPLQQVGVPLRPTEATVRNAAVGQNQSGLRSQLVQPVAPQGPLAQALSNSAQLNSGPGPLADANLVRLVQLANQNRVGSIADVISGLPDSITSIGDLRAATVPQTLSYSQSNVLLVTTSGIAGSYNFAMTINLNPNPALRSLTATASNINVGGPNWPATAFTGGTLTINNPAPNFGGQPDGVIGQGVSTGCASGVDCQFGVYMLTIGGRVAKSVVHNVIVYAPPGAPPPPVPGTSIAVGAGVVTRP